MASAPRGVDDDAEVLYPDEISRPWGERIALALILATSAGIVFVAIRVLLGVVGVW